MIVCVILACVCKRLPDSRILLWKCCVDTKTTSHSHLQTNVDSMQCSVRVCVYGCLLLYKQLYQKRWEREKDEKWSIEQAGREKESDCKHKILSKLSKRVWEYKWLAARNWLVKHAKVWCYTWCALILSNLCVNLSVCWWDLWECGWLFLRPVGQIVVEVVVVAAVSLCVYPIVAIESQEWKRVPPACFDLLLPNIPLTDFVCFGGVCLCNHFDKVNSSESISIS